MSVSLRFHGGIAPRLVLRNDRVLAPLVDIFGPDVDDARQFVHLDLVGDGANKEVVVRHFADGLLGNLDSCVRRLPLHQD